MKNEINCCPNRDREKANHNQECAGVVYLNSETMGRGDDALGARLMAVFLDTLANFTPRISHLVMVNSAVKLACADSPALEQLQALESTGIEILSCGTCLKHFEATDSLKAGKVSNMMDIIEVMTSSQRLITP